MFGKISGMVAGVSSVLISIVMTTLLTVNFLAGIVGGVWLAVKGEWGSIGLGIVLAVIMPTTWILASLPSIGLTLLIGLFVDRDSHTFTAIFGFLNSVYEYILIALWVSFVFSLFIGRGSSATHVPYLLWGYSSMMAPLIYMSSKENPEDTATSLGLICAQLFFLILTFFWFFGAYPETILVIFSCIIVVFSLLVVFLAVASMPQR